MKKFLLFIFLALFTQTFAQLDREHWFAPMMDRGQTGSNRQTIYMSTSETTPFTVDIYHNNVVISTVTLSKGNPVKYSIANSERERIITTDDYDLFKPVAMGIYLKGEKPFYASLRFSIYNHAEIQTSKGSAALGTEFRAVVAPITTTGSYVTNFMNSIMATEDNTTVTITEFEPTLRFSDGVIRTEINFTLNKGQSYIIEGKGTDIRNSTGYIGAKIVASKPVVIANGNFNGQYAGNFPSSTDILMDQGVPIDKLGQEFVLMKGNGEIGNNMEKALIVATEDNTQIYINDNSIPVAVINAGDFYTTNNSAYRLQTSGHYNMFIRASKNIYVYQLLAGTGSSGGSEEATGGMNYIPPLSCYLPRKIDEIGLINENLYSSNTTFSGQLTVPTKLNIITEKNAVIKVFRNGVPLLLNSNNGPFLISGNNNWVTYSIPNVSGNISVESTHAVTAGISAGDNSVGYGGYFAGFSYIPAVIKIEGECLPGVKLEVTAGFNNYQWLLKVGNTYQPAPGVNNEHVYSPLEAGIYAVKLQQGSCPEVQTQDFKFYNCTTYTNFSYDTCTSQIITPQFSLSTQTINPASLVIDTPPTKGTVTINANGQLVYTANPNATGTDTFKYSFCGTGLIPDCETAQATINLNQVNFTDAVLEACSDTNTGIFDLTKANVTNQQNITKTYYTSLQGAENQTPSELIPTAQLTTYTSASTNIYVRLSNDFGCVSYAKIEIKVLPKPVIQTQLFTKIFCDEEIDGIIDGVYKANLDQITAVVLQNPSNYTVNYYDTEAKANAGNTDVLPTNYNFNANTRIWIRVVAANTCITVKPIDLVIGSKIVLINTNITHTVCKTTTATTESISLSNYIALFNNAAGVTATYYTNATDAQNNTNAINASQTINDGLTTFYYRISSASSCADIGQLNINLQKGLSSDTLPASVTICEGTTTLLDVGPGFTQVIWYDATNNTVIGNGQTITVPTGKYYVDLYSAGNCYVRQNVEVIAFSKADLNTNLFNATICDDNLDGKVTVDFAQEVTPIILQNPTLYQVRYYDTEAKANAGGNNNLANSFTYTTDQSVWVRVDSPYCPFIISKIDFKIGNRIQLINNNVVTTVCDDNLDGIKDVNLDDFKALFSNNNLLSLTYYKTLADAQERLNAIPQNSTINNTDKIFYRFESGNECPEIGELNITIKIPKTSATLTDKIICPETTTTLNAGSGFTNYTWSTGATTQSITNIGIGDYWVDLEADGCTYRQHVKVTATTLPEIKAIKIDGSTVTIIAEGGQMPYMYALDNGLYQASNVFTNVTPGMHTIQIISADNCAPIVKEFSIIKIVNAFTPNGDSYNETIDYTALTTKEEPKFVVIDRYGKKVFDSEISKTFIWDGKVNGLPLPTSSYWFILEWKEFGVEAKTQKTGWILLKNR